MATLETQKLDNIIASRRSLLTTAAGAALAATFLPKKASAALTDSNTGLTLDADILNFALNLEYLESQFYYYAAFGAPITTTQASNASAYALMTAAGALTGIGVGAGTATTGTGTVTIKSTSTKVPFTSAAAVALSAYAVETAVEEGKHVNFLRNALGASAVAMPNIDLLNSFYALGKLLSPSVPAFDPFSADVFFLLGAYIFEDVGVTAYHGAAPLITQDATGKTYLAAAASILAVEAYHSGLVRTAINALDQDGTKGYLSYTQQISNLRATAAKAAFSGSGTVVTPDDFGLYPGTYPQAGTTIPTTTGLVSLAGAAGVTATNIADADATNVIAFSRNTTQVLNIVTNGGALTANTKAMGAFFPNGMNGNLA